MTTSRSVSILILSVILSVTFIVTSSNAEEWTAEQKEVWNRVVSFWEKAKKGDYEGLQDGIHDDAIALIPKRAAPLGKPGLESYYQNWIIYGKPVSYELKPYSVQIFGDIAHVLYASKWQAEHTYSGNGYSLVTFKRENGKWLSLTRVSVSCDNKPKCSGW